MQYPYSEYREPDGKGGEDNTAWGRTSTDKAESKPVE